MNLQILSEIDFSLPSKWSRPNVRPSLIGSSFSQMKIWEFSLPNCYSWERGAWSVHRSSRHTVFDCRHHCPNHPHSVPRTVIRQGQKFTPRTRWGTTRKQKRWQTEAATLSQQLSSKRRVWANGRPLPGSHLGLRCRRPETDQEEAARIVGNRLPRVVLA